MAKNYHLEVWGAQGGGYGSHQNAPGGYAGGWKNLSKNQVLYVVVGGKGIDQNHYSDGTSYNGGGIIKRSDGSNFAGGGGATHIATATGLLKDLVNNKTAVICVGGGAGSNGDWAEQDIAKYECGGGEVGLGSPTTYFYWVVKNVQVGTQPCKGDTGGTQTGCGPDGVKGGFGYGGGFVTTLNTGAGGGGWYGGNASGDGGVTNQTHGGGGSGYIGGLTNGEFKTGVRSGHGYAVISWHPNI